MSLKIIAAMSNNWVIGSENTIPWVNEADNNHFKQAIEGHDLIVGRKTYQTTWHLPRLIVLSREKLKVKDLHRDDTRIARSVDEVMSSCSPDTFVIGGEQIYRLFLPLAQRLYLTQINVAVPGDTFFPDFGRRQWQLVNDWRRKGCRFHVFEKVQNAVL